MNLESIVPSFEDCRAIIPAGKFADSALVWGNKYVWERREALNNEWHTSMIPAPTLAEILAELPDGTYIKKHESSPMYEVFSPIHNIGYSDDNPGIAALRLWFRVKGIEVKA